MSYAAASYALDGTELFGAGTPARLPKMKRLGRRNS